MHIRSPLPTTITQTSTPQNDSLTHSLQSLTHTPPGEEEIPEGVVGLLTPDAPDVLSHVSVRARNMHVLFATCHDEEPLQQIKDMRGE